jgi:hypothetical protein
LWFLSTSPSPFERTLLQGIQQRYSTQLNEAIQRLSSLRSDQAIQILENPGLARLFDIYSIEQRGVNCEQITELGYSRLRNLKLYIFQNWMFTKQQGELALRLQVEEDSGRSCAESYSAFLELFVDKDLYRVKLLEDSNIDIRSRLGICPSPTLMILPAESDDQIWAIMVGILLCHRTQLQNIGKQSPWLDDNTYRVWQVAQQFSLACRRPENGTLVDKHLTPLIREMGMNFCQPAFSTTDLGHKAAIKSVARTSPLPWEGPARPGSLHDPRDCVELIPWSELEPVYGDELEDARIPIHLPQLTGIVKETLDMNWMLWRPPSSHFFDSHCLYTEDEVYQYCIENKWHFPGHMYGDKVVFARSPLEDSLFVDDFKNFWGRWVRALSFD